MKQSIDFYKALRKGRVPSKAVLTLMASWGLVVVLYLGGFSYMYFSQEKLEQSLLEDNALIVELDKELKARANSGQLTGEKSLEDSIALLKKERQERRMLIRKFKDPIHNNVEGFSTILTALAQQHRGGIAISDIQVKENGASFYLAGKVVRPRDVPDYIVRLGNEKAFENMSFNNFKITESTKQSRGDGKTEHEFEIQSLSKM